MSKNNEQTVKQSVEKALEKTPAQVEVLELDETMLDIVSGGSKEQPHLDPSNKRCNSNFICL